MDYYDEWGYYNVPQRPGQRRGRLASDRLGSRPPYYRGPNGELLVPAGPGHIRSNSMSGVARPTVNIINEPGYDHFEDFYERPRSHSRSPREPDAETREKLKKLKELEQKEEDAEREKRLKEKMLLAKAKEEAEERERKENEKKLKEKAIEEWKEEERKKKEKEKEEKEKADKEYEERMRKMLWANGYTDSAINKMVKRSEKKEKGEHGEHGEHGESSGKIITLSRPTYIRIKRRYLDPVTLDAYNLPWEWDEEDNSYVIIKRWINESDQEILFEHTKKLRETKQLTYTTTELRKERDQLYLVKKKERKKSPAKVLS